MCVWKRMLLLKFSMCSISFHLNKYSVYFLFNGFMKIFSGALYIWTITAFPVIFSTLSLSHVIGISHIVLSTWLWSSGSFQFIYCTLINHINMGIFCNVRSFSEGFLWTFFFFLGIINVLSLSFLLFSLFPESLCGFFFLMYNWHMTLYCILPVFVIAILLSVKWHLYI